MQIGQSKDFCLSDIAESKDGLEPVCGTANGPITHLLVRRLECTPNQINVYIMVACKDNSTSIIHVFDVSLFFSQNETTGAAIPVANIEEFSTSRSRGVIDWLSPSKRRFRWLESLHISQNDAQPIWLITDLSMTKAALIAASSLADANLILATLNPNGEIVGGSKSSQCVLFSHDSLGASATLRTVDQIRPLVPTSAGFVRHQGKPGQEAANKGFYTNMLARAGIDNPPTRIRSLEEEDNDVSARVCDHIMNCGQVAWGKGRYGRDLGAFLYEPGSLLDEGISVALFELKP